MKVRKKVISDLTLCYCVAPLNYHGEDCFLVASEKEYACLLFDRHGNQLEEVWPQPGGTMSAVQYPGSDGAFLATHKFYSPNNCKEARLVLCVPENGKWKIICCAELPYVHRFDILERGGQYYVIACCIKSGYEGKDDWRFPGMTLAAPLPTLEALCAGEQLKFTLLRDGMLKNHGYCRTGKDGDTAGLVTCDDGVYRFTPPAQPDGVWQSERLIADATSDVVPVDFDNDGEDELLTLSPFHGDTLRVYKKQNGVYTEVYRYEKPIEFAHAICAGRICGENMAIVGHRKGARDLLAVRWDGAGYRVELLDHDVGPANAMHMVVDGQDVIVSANREINEVGYYVLTAD